MFTQVVTIHIASLLNGTHQYLFGNFSSFLVEVFCSQPLDSLFYLQKPASKKRRTKIGLIIDKY